MRSAVLFVPVLLAACTSGTIGGGGDAFRLRNPSCDEDFVAWGGGLTEHLVQGPEGAFDYDPLGSLSTRVAGTYSLETGDYDWTVEYADGHWRTQTLVEGYGYAKTNGDLDIESTFTTTDVLGATFTSTVREIREGCDVRRRTEADGTVTVEEGTFADGAYTYSEESTVDGAPWVVTGTLEPDLSFTESLAGYSGPTYTYAYDRTGDGTGYSTTDWSQTEGSTSYVGTSEVFPDGSREQSYTVSSTQGSATVSYTLDYAGNGSGTYATSQGTCTLTFVQNACTYDCGGGQTGAC